MRQVRRHPGNRRGQGQRGAALVIAISIMTILLAISLTFFAVTRVELKTATNVTNAVRVEFLARAGVAIAVATLNQDLLDHPEATSLDHAWRTLFNGAAFAGKPWALRGNLPLQSGGVPWVNLDGAPYVDVNGDGIPDERLYLGPATRGWLHVPRSEEIVGNGAPFGVFYARGAQPMTAAGGPIASFLRLDNEDPNFSTSFPSEYFPFVTSSFYGQVFRPDGSPVFSATPQYAPEQIHQWTDVDNSGDGLRDAMWVPLPIDIFLSNDGIDNDLDGIVDNPVEGAPFVYWGGGDGIDNDGDGLIDQDDNPNNPAAQAPFEYFPGVYDPDIGVFPASGAAFSGVDNSLGFFLTAPLPGIRVKVDLDADGVIGDDGDFIEDPVTGNPILAEVVLPPEITVAVRVSGPDGAISVSTVTLTAANVDQVDNDHDMLANDYHTYAYLGPVQDEWRPFDQWTDVELDRYAAVQALGYTEVNMQRLGVARTGAGGNEAWAALYERPLFLDSAGDPTVDLGSGAAFSLRVTHSGEPVCELAGRAAITIRDEQSRVAVNAAGGHVYREQFGDFAPEVQQGAMVRAMDEGATPHEYETRAMPGMGVRLSGKLWGYLMGSPKGFVLPIDGAAGDNILADGDPAQLGDFYTDLSFPGYGRVDDNANALVVGLNGINDNGNFDLDVASRIEVDNAGNLLAGADFPRLVDEGLFLPRLSLAAESVLTGVVSPSGDINAAYGAGIAGLDVALNRGVVSIAPDVLTEVYGRFAPYYLRLGALEGVDEPGEFQYLRPLRNLVAENDTIPGTFEPLNNDPNDINDAANEYGELADRTVRNVDELQNISGIGDTIGPRLGALLSPFAADHNVRLFRTRGGVKALPKVDFNRAPARQVAAELLLSGRFDSITRTTVPSPDPAFAGAEISYFDAGVDAPPVIALDGTTAARLFAEGLRSADVAVRAPLGGLLYAADTPGGADYVPSTTESLGHRIPEDPVLSALQAAVDIVDSRDADHARSVLSTDISPGWAQPLEPGVRETPQDELIDLAAIAEYADDQLELADPPRLDIVDDWWGLFVNYQEDLSEDALPDQRRISYTVAGAEAVRINEIMPRAVRRVEAEATPDAENFGDNGGVNPQDGRVDAYYPNFDPTPFAQTIFTGIPDPDSGLPVFASQLPEFILQRVNVFSRYGAGVGAQLDWRYFPTTTSPLEQLGGDWGLGTVRKWTRGLDPAVGHPAENMPNVAEFLFLASPGLPAGRYYLTVNLAAGAGSMSVENGQLLRYAVKYVPVQLNSATGLYVPIDRTIVDDVAYYASLMTTDGTVGGPTDPVFAGTNPWVDPLTVQGRYLEAAFVNVPQEHMAVQGPHPRRRGWAFLDGSPEKFASEVENIETALGPNPPAATPEGELYYLLRDNYYERALYFGLDPGKTLGNSLAPWAPQPEVDAGTGAITGFLDTHTVLVPPPSFYVDSIDDEKDPVQYALCVAVMLDPAAPDDQELYVNFFDFSQEPDHEYVELVNVSDEPVDIGGWELEIGAPVPEGVTANAFDPRYDDADFLALSLAGEAFRPLNARVPNGTVITPGGMVLLAVNKFDTYQVPGVDDTVPLLYRNGIGMAQGAVPPGFAIDLDAGFFAPFDSGNQPLAFVTAPALPVNDKRWPVYNPGTLAGDPTGSPLGRVDLTFMDWFPPLFRADNTSFADLVDRMGTGGDDLNLLRPDPDTGDPPLLANATRAEYPALWDAAEASTPPDAGPWATPENYPNKPWDRVVQLELAAEWARSTDVDAIAKLVLAGGLFPNYPEYDGIDNDGDNLVLQSDLVDNNLTGRIDELGEGVDEGRTTGDVLLQAGGFLEGTLPLVFWNAAGILYANAIVISGEDGIPAAPGDITVGDTVDRVGFENTGNTVEGPYVGSDLDPVEWKAFVERRWYPGDAVLVTLYAGPASSGRVADRATYTQLDVENRGADDIAPNPYPAGLNALYPSFWLPNHMGLDFYKALERRHPLYHGDRFGTSNRWEATDGAYDDWADATVPWERLLNQAEWPYAPLDDQGSYYFRFYDPLRHGDATPYFSSPAVQAVVSNQVDPDGDPVYPERNQRAFGHALSGTPLRMNTAARVLGNPVLDPGAAPDTVNSGYRLFNQNATFLVADTWRAGDWREEENAGWALDEARVRDGNFASPGDLMAVPRVRFDVPLVNAFALDNNEPETIGYGYRYTTGAAPVNLANAGAGPVAHDPATLRGAMLGQAGPDSPTEAVFAAAADTHSGFSRVLTVGQAKFTPIRPNANDPNLELPVGYDTFESLFTWRGAGSNPVYPRGWAPVFLFRFSPADAFFALPGESEEARPLLYTYPRPLDVADLTAYRTGYEQQQWPSLLNPFHLFSEADAGWNVNSVLAAYGAQAGGAERWAARWPLESRAVAYVAENTASLNPDSLYAEALFEWDADDGLENGVYTLYIGTFVPRLREALVRAQAASTGAQLPAAAGTAQNPPWAGYDFLAATTTVDGQLAVGAVLPDPVADGTKLDPELETMAMVVEAHTDRARTGGIFTGAPTALAGEGVGLEWWEDPGRMPSYIPGTDGYFLYGRDGGDGWQPIPVEVTDNYLALRVLNVSPPGVPNIITHVVLAPEPRTRGRVNVNTAEPQAVQGNSGVELFSALLGLPGIVNADPNNPENRPDNLLTANLSMPSAQGTLTSAAAWLPPDGEYLAGNTGFTPSRAVPPFRTTVAGGGVLSDDGSLRTSALQLMGLLMEGRTEHADGRYYTGPSQLVLDRNAFEVSRPEPEAEAVPPGGRVVYPLSNEDSAKNRFIDKYERFRRMANLVTTRSDTFEIIVTVQSGYGVDLDNDGFINYRSDDEFVATAESRVRSVYDRRVPRALPQPPGLP